MPRNSFVGQDGTRDLVAFCGSQDGSLSCYCMYPGHGTWGASSKTVMTSGSGHTSDSIQEIYTKVKPKWDVLKRKAITLHGLSAFKWP